MKILSILCGLILSQSMCTNAAHFYGYVRNPDGAAMPNLAVQYQMVGDGECWYTDSGVGCGDISRKTDVNGAYATTDISFAADYNARVYDTYSTYNFTPAIYASYIDGANVLINFTRTNTAPGLDYTGEASYINDAVFPLVEMSSNSFSFRVKYTDENNDAPLTGYPRVLVKKGAVVVSTLTMNYVSGTNLAGAIYSTATLLAPCSFYTWTVEARDFNSTVTTTTLTGLGPDVRGFISGTVRDANSVAMAGVTMTLTGDESSAITTDVNGAYVFNWVQTGAYTVTPSSHAYYTFTPVSRSTAALVNNIAAWDFARNNTGAAADYTNEAGYTADMVEPNIGVPENPFIFRFTYIDAENDMPAAGYPKLHIKKGGLAVSGSPFTMTAAAAGDLDAMDGKIYAYSKTLATMAVDYTYYIEAKDAQNGAVAATAELSGPNVAHQPTLTWTGEAGYTADGVNPDTGTVSNTYAFHVKYTDVDNLAPAAGYPKIHILKAGAEISGSPFAMSYLSGNHNTGSIYSYQTALSTGIGYTYQYEALNQSLYPAAIIAGYGPQVRTKIAGYVRDLASNPLGSVTLTLSGAESATYLTAADGYYEFLITTNTFNVVASSHAYYTFTPADRDYVDNQADLATENYTRNSVAPVLTWTNEGGYEADGVEPGIAQSSNTFTFRIKYTNSTGDAPAAGYPRVLVKRGGVVVSTLTMNYVSGTNLAGAIYSTATLLAPYNYTYVFEAKDAFNTTADPATGLGPDVRGFISGTVRDANSAAMSGVTLTLAGDADSALATGADGTFLFPGLPAGGNYTVTPSSHAYYSFAPVSLSTAALVNNIAAWDFARNNTGAAADWTGEAGYEADGVVPNIGAPENPFIFRFTYIDAENDMPAAGYPKLHIKKGGLAVSGSPFTMTAAEAGDLDAMDGKIYAYSKTLATIGADYTYYIEAKDAQNGAVAATAELSGPNVAHQPTLTWAGVAGYIADGISPDTSTVAATYTYEIKYTDVDNLAPAAGYPKIHILKAGAEISGSPFAMSYLSGNHNTGSLYTYQTTLPFGMDYTYQFEAQNQYLSAAVTRGGYGPQVRSKISGYVKDLGNNPLSDITLTLAGAEAKTYKTVSDGYFEFLITTETYTVTPSSHAYYTFTPGQRDYLNQAADAAFEGFARDAIAPVLAWTGEAGYTSSVASPVVAMSSNTYTFRVNYLNANNDGPAAGYPRVLVKKGAATVQTLTMNYVSGTNLAGAIYSTATLLAPCSFYTYTVEAKDIYDTTGTPLNETGPDVRAYIAGTVRDANSAAMGGVTLTLAGNAAGSMVTVADGAYSFTMLPAGGNYTVTPSSHAYYTFTPVSRSTSLVTNLAGWDFARNNYAPTLTWSSETNYEDIRGVWPSTGVTNDDTFIFKVVYEDVDDEAYKSLNLYLKKDGVVISTIPLTDCYGDFYSGLTCSYGTLISTSGVYAYRFGAVGRWDETITTPEKTFLSMLPPSAPTNDAAVIEDNQTLVSSEVTLKWSAADPEGGPITYAVYVSQNSSQVLSVRAGFRPAASAAALVYTGTDTSYTLRNLVPGKTYYWKVNATNQYGVTTAGSVMSFTTLETAVNKVFNYPNPFNPTKTKTNIVFRVNSPQIVKIKIYSEYGDLVNTIEAAAAAGTNEVKFDGRDKSGQLLFNGSYIAKIERAEGAAKCYILIVK